MWTRKFAFNAEFYQIWACEVLCPIYSEFEKQKMNGVNIQLIPYPSSYAAPNLCHEVFLSRGSLLKKESPHPVPLNKYPALSPLVLNAHLVLRSKISSEKRSPKCSPSSNISFNPIKCLSIPRPVAASRVSRVWVCSALRSNVYFSFIFVSS
jgi:hypothetical protein